MKWILKKFEELSTDELYAILQLRNEVFVVEQNCVFQDADNKDQAAFHFTGWEIKKLFAYTRIIPPGEAYPEPAIGRVVISPAARGGGSGKELMLRSIQAIRRLFGQVPVKIGAQLYLQEFYSSFGFRQTGAIYLEDGIEHIEMTLS